MNDVLRWIEIFSPWATALFVISAPFAIGAVYWQLQKHFKPRAEIEAADRQIEAKLDTLIEKVGEITEDGRTLRSRLDVLERLEQGEPSRHELSREISDLKSGLASVNAGQAGLRGQVTAMENHLRGQFNTMDAYLRDFIDREGRKS
ncbi:hypothetical protein B5C34_05335 [Pacificimonas flava]|uniref:Uncharacterized protein n=2 Tax=Pacificimonas TaxID=1960290 RepID=A0A219B3M3_9SPHN|nr:MULTISPECIES: hypothetical protein [Pacificimonas]MBZ6377357.1 hypothetical protein [Pacificimonas aurantium]OWV32935.1 hypothetical protein B5C34_05335 [Pacificimonas flava]